MSQNKFHFCYAALECKAFWALLNENELRWEHPLYFTGDQYIFTSRKEFCVSETGKTGAEY